MSSVVVKEECPTCRGHGIVPLKDALPEEALVCPQCDGKGWRAVNHKPFKGRPARKAGVKVIRRSTGACPPLDAARTGNLMTYDEFDQFFPG